MSNTLNHLTRIRNIARQLDRTTGLDISEHIFNEHLPHVINPLLDKQDAATNEALVRAGTDIRVHGERIASGVTDVAPGVVLTVSDVQNCIQGLRDAIAEIELEGRKK